MSEPILTQYPVTIDLSASAMRWIVDALRSVTVPTTLYQTECEIDNFENLLENLLERGAGKVTISNNEDLL